MTVGTDTLVGDMPFRGRLAVLVGAGDRSAADLLTGLDQDGGAGPCCRSASSSRWPVVAADSNPAPRSGSGRSGLHACVRGVPGVWWGDEVGTPGSSDYLHCRHDRLPTLMRRGFDWHKTTNVDRIPG